MRLYKLAYCDHALTNLKHNSLLLAYNISMASRQHTTKNNVVRENATLMFLTSLLSDWISLSKYPT